MPALDLRKAIKDHCAPRCSADSRVKLWKWTGKWRQQLGVDRKGKLSKLTRIGSGQKGETITTDKQKGLMHRKYRIGIKDSRT
jgi:hypothetical protein